MDNAFEREKILLASVHGITLKQYCGIVAACLPEDGLFNTIRETPELLQGCNCFVRARINEIVNGGGNGLFGYAENYHAKLIAYGSSGYPESIALLPDAPPLLYVRGNANLLDEGGIAIVGARLCTEYGRETARTLSRAAAEKDICIISGLARGIDAAAHAGALEANGKTIAVIGTGINKCYPAENNELFRRILASGGAIVSEQPFDEPPRPEHFPMRNRLITALAQALLVIEAGEKSGALITCRHAQAQGLPVAAVPGNIDSPNSLGSNRLLREGASVITCAEDVFHLVGVDADTVHKTVTVTPDERKIIDLLRANDMNADELAEISGFLPQNLACLLTTMELRGIVYNAAGGLIALRRGQTYINQTFTEDSDGSADS